MSGVWIGIVLALVLLTAGGAWQVWTLSGRTRGPGRLSARERRAARLRRRAEGAAALEKEAERERRR